MTKREMTNGDSSSDKVEVFNLKPYNHGQLAKMYGVCWVTFQRWIARYPEMIGEKIGHFYSIKQVLTIFKILGVPKRCKLTMEEVEEMLKR